MTDRKEQDLMQRKQDVARRLAKLGAESSATYIRHRPRGITLYCVYLLIDCSSSMDGSKLSQAKTGSIGFAESAFHKGYSVGIISFASQVHLVSEPLSDSRQLGDRVKKLMVEGSTNLAGALRFVAEKFTSPVQGGTVVVVTDGMPDNKDAAVKAAQRLKSMGVNIITIGTDDADQQFLEQISSHKDLAVRVVNKRLASGIVTAAKLLPNGGEK